MLTKKLGDENQQILCITAKRLDTRSAIELREAIALAMQEQPGDLLLDLSQVSFMDSSGLGALVLVYKQLAPGRTMVLFGLTPTVRRLFEMTRMDRVFTLAADEIAALASCK